MPVETVLTYSLTIIGVLLSMLIALVVYVFVSLKSEVVKVATEVGDLNKNRAKLVHKDECHSSVGRMHSRLDEFESAQHELAHRVTRVEAQLELLEQEA